ncbi:DUF2239 domain-containing protein [Phenylobacterium hankyongense]|uniref:DUF2239 domain-containing protein n=1 Tax=Phenylobacterium hankyongense TaxID=1813876 RepID=A0A328B0G1_9CAUL|nr:DUF2239 family protein [Phenylobacterium hankyongense]RAK60892.1 DUF2239 domain-containing protein [Phenylobacterium hankyongense]
MSDPADETFTAFAGHRAVARGTASDVARAAHGHLPNALLVFDDATGRQVDLDLRGSADDVVARLAPSPQPKAGRGRPKLGVVAREVTLLPRHWDWLAGQPGGASAALRRLVDQARRQGSGADQARRAQEAAHRVMTAIAGDLPDYEDALRALYAGDRPRLHSLIAAWPADVGAYVSRLAAAEGPQE